MTSSRRLCRQRFLLLCSDGQSSCPCCPLLCMCCLLCLCSGHPCYMLLQRGPACCLRRWKRRALLPSLLVRRLKLLARGLLGDCLSRSLHEMLLGLLACRRRRIVVLPPLVCLVSCLRLFPIKYWWGLQLLRLLHPWLCLCRVRWLLWCWLLCLLP